MNEVVCAHTVREVCKFICGLFHGHTRYSVFLLLPSHLETVVVSCDNGREGLFIDTALFEIARQTIENEPHASAAIFWSIGEKYGKKFSFPLFLVVVPCSPREALSSPVMLSINSRRRRPDKIYRRLLMK